MAHLSPEQVYKSLREMELRVDHLRELGCRDWETRKINLAKEGLYHPWSIANDRDKRRVKVLARILNGLLKEQE